MAKGFKRGNIKTQAGRASSAAAAENLPGREGLLLRLVGLGGGTGGWGLAWGGTGGGLSESAEEGAASTGLDASSTISETVLGGLATATGTEDEEEEDDEEEGVGLRASVEGMGRTLGGSRACLGGGGSCCVSLGGGSWTKRTPADSTEGLHTTQTNGH